VGGGLEQVLDVGHLFGAQLACLAVRSGHFVPELGEVEFVGEDLGEDASPHDSVLAELAGELASALAPVALLERHALAAVDALVLRVVAVEAERLAGQLLGLFQFERQVLVGLDEGWRGADLVELVPQAAFGARLDLALSPWAALDVLGAVGRVDLVVLEFLVGLAVGVGQVVAGSVALLLEVDRDLVEDVADWAVLVERLLFQLVLGGDWLFDHWWGGSRVGFSGDWGLGGDWLFDLSGDWLFDHWWGGSCVGLGCWCNLHWDLDFIFLGVV